MYMYTCTHVCMCTCIHAHMYMCIHVCIHICICIYVYMDVCVHHHRDIHCAKKAAYASSCGRKPSICKLRWEKIKLGSAVGQGR